MDTAFEKYERLLQLGFKASGWWSGRYVTTTWPNSQSRFEFIMDCRNLKVYWIEHKTKRYFFFFKYSYHVATSLEQILDSQYTDNNLKDIILFNLDLF